MKLRCACGKVFEVDSSQAGKGVRCPACGKVSRIPASQGKPAPTPEPSSDASSDETCPGCGAALAADAVLCVACGFDRRSGEKIRFSLEGGSDLPPIPETPSSSVGLIVGVVLFVILAVAATIFTCRSRPEPRKKPAATKTTAEPKTPAPKAAPAPKTAPKKSTKTKSAPKKSTETKTTPKEPVETKTTPKEPVATPPEAPESKE